MSFTYKIFFEAKTLLAGLSNLLQKQQAEMGVQLRKKEIMVEEYRNRIAALEEKFEEDIYTAMFVSNPSPLFSF